MFNCCNNKVVPYKYSYREYATDLARLSLFIINDTISIEIPELIKPDIDWVIEYLRENIDHKWIIRYDNNIIKLTKKVIY